MKERKYEGFSLIEILVVVALIVILATITIVAINPTKNFRDTRNAQRSTDVMQILNAVTQFTSEEGHTLADLESGSEVEKCEDGATKIGTTDENGYINLQESDLVEEYIVAIPQDPSVGNEADTHYTICQTESGRIQVAAIREGDGEPIVVKR